MGKSKGGEMGGAYSSHWEDEKYIEHCIRNTWRVETTLETWA